MLVKKIFDGKKKKEEERKINIKINVKDIYDKDEVLKR